MVTTVTLNPCIDRTLKLPRLLPGQLNLVEEARTDVGGKGTNVSMVLRELGVATQCTGISFTGNGTVLSGLLDNLGIPYDFVMAPGEIRTNIKVLDAEKNEMTELNSKGDRVEPSCLEALLEKLRTLAKDSGIVAICGRIANGADDGIYRRAVQVAAAGGAKVVLDAEGEPLRLALAERPYLIKPNLYELEKTFGLKAGSDGELLAACRKVINMGAGVVCVSMGERGALITDGREAWRAPALPITPLGFQGAGDSMVGGICKAIAEGAGLKHMLACGMAAAAASLVREGTQLCQRPDFDRFLTQVRVERLA